MPLPETPRLSARLPWLALLLSLAGCATSSLDLAPPRPDRPWDPQVNADGAIIPGPARADRRNRFTPMRYSYQSFVRAVVVHDSSIYLLM